MTDARQKPITGNEDLAGLSGPVRALAEFYAAFNGRDMDAMANNWEHGESAVMKNPLGGIKRGWAEISEVYRRIFNGPATVYVEFYDYSIVESPGMFLASGRERGRALIGRETIELAIRTSRVYRLVDGRWRQVHHHGSFDDPELLKKYRHSVSTPS